MGAVRMRDQAADKNITIIHTTPVHQLTSCKEIYAWSVHFSFPIQIKLLDVIMDYLALMMDMFLTNT